jgi:hypothetical protein
MNKTELNKTKELLKKQSEEFKKSQQSSLRVMLSTIFDALPEVETISFTGYTPHFNDGDECKFSCNSEYPAVNGYDSNDCDWEDRVEREKNVTDAASELADLVGKLLNVIPRDLFGSVFGTSGFRATITRTNIKVEDYDCGY